MDRYKVFPSGELGMSPTGNWTPHADAQATVEALQAQLEAAERHNTILQDANKVALEKVEALQAQLVTLKRHADLDCGDQSCLYAMNHGGMRTNGGCRCSPKRMKDDLERSRKAVEALKRERDVWREKATHRGKVAHDLQTQLTEWHTKYITIQSALDAEREKVKDFEAAAGAMSCKEIADKVAGYTQLKALVRALPVVRIELNGAYHDTLLARPEDDAVKELLRYRASLDATTPAPDTSIIGKCEPPSQWDPNAQVRGDIS